jgi:hypothetical protein
MYDQAGSNKRVVMVLGMARSGTSTICRGLNAIGVNLGKKMLWPDRRNPKGFWEDMDVTFKINRGLVRLLNYPWICEDLAAQMRALHNHALKDFKNYAVLLVGERLAGRSNWGFKDPNTTVLLPFWQSVLNEVQAEDSYVIALRNPLGCAYSNIKHSDLELEGGLLAWLKNIILAVDGSQGKKRVVVSYEKLLEYPLNELLRMRRDLSIYSASQQDMEDYARRYVDKNLQHHVYSDNDLVTHPAIAAVPLCLRVYNLLKRLADDTLSFVDDEFYTEWQSIKQEFNDHYPLYFYARSIQMENKQLERELRGIRKALPWKLFSPLWLLDDFLRARRRAGRQYKRLTKAYG